MPLKLFIGYFLNLNVTVGITRIINEIIGKSTPNEQIINLLQMGTEQCSQLEVELAK
jgi:hypothetical protein